MKRSAPILTLTILLVLAGSVLAMGSANYKLAPFIPLTGSGGGKFTSTHYAARATVGQSVTGASSSANYGSCLGYWCGTEAGDYMVYLPLTLRNF